MLGPFSQRILTLLQLTRMALVFTAIADSAAEVLLRAAKAGEMANRSYLDELDLKCLAAMAITSVGLYGFGMSLNDIIDRRRDSRLAADRPLPSGRVRLVTAHTICAGLALMAICGGAAYAHWTEPTGMMSLMLMAVTGMVITFYDFAGKYLVALGLLSLGVIRLLHAMIAFPQLELLVVWHPLLLLDHVALLSAVGYHWEQKRPPLGPTHWWTVIGGLLGINLLMIVGIGWKRGDETLGGLPKALDMRTALLLPAAAIVVFIGIAYVIRKRNPVSREAGQKLMLYGLLWLIVYDAAFVAGYVSWAAGLALLTLLPIAWWSVKFMRAWSRLVALSQRPAFQRART